MGFGLSLAVGYRTPVFRRVGINRSAAVGAHATLAVFGAVLTTVVGALYQSATMFTQSELAGVDLPPQRFEATLYPVGVLLLAGGRLLGAPRPTRVGGVLVVRVPRSQQDFHRLLCSLRGTAAVSY